MLHGSSTPREQYPTHPSPHTNDNHTVPPIEPKYTSRPSPAPSNGGNLADITQMFVTHLDENRKQANLLKHRRDLLSNIAYYDGKDKKTYLMWINQLEQTAVQARIPLKELLAAKAGSIIMTAVTNFLAREPNARDSQVKQMILESFSNVGTRIEANNYLKRMRIESDESLIAHNAEYAAVHEAAYGITPENQTNQAILIDYVKTLSDVTSDKLIRRILREDTYIETLAQAMTTAEKINQQARQEEITKRERDSMRETTISEESINEVSLSEEVNFMSPRSNENRFNSTMKNSGGRWNNSPRGRNSSYYNSQSGRNNYSYSDNKSWSPRHNYSNNYDAKRRLRRYRHQPRDPKNQVSFEYNIADRNMMSNLRRMVNSLKDEPQNYRDRFKKMAPRFTNRSQEEVREDAIAEIKIEQIQEILNEDLDLIFDALVIQDYIDEVDA